MRRMFLVLAVTTSLLTPVWNLLSALWDDSAGADEGCIWDPDGQCRPAPQTEEGCIWDPNGQCRPTPQTDAGCIWDPSGGCAQGS